MQVTNQIPSANDVTSLLRANHLIMFIGIHDYSDDIWQHTHGAIFGYKSSLSQATFLEESKLMTQLRKNLKRYITAGRKQRMRKEKTLTKKPTDVRPVFDDTSNLHDYLSSRHNNLLDYISIRGDYSHPYPFYTLYESL